MVDLLWAQTWGQYSPYKRAWSQKRKQPDWCTLSLQRWTGLITACRTHLPVGHIWSQWVNVHTPTCNFYLWFRITDKYCCSNTHLIWILLVLIQFYSNIVSFHTYIICSRANNKQWTKRELNITTRNTTSHAIDEWFLLLFMISHSSKYV